MSEKLYTVGKIVNTHGIRGELKIVPQTDFADERFAAGSKLVFVDPNSSATLPVTVESAREHKTMFIIRFRGFGNINEVEKYKGWLLKVEEKYLSELPDGEFYYHEIVGCTVVTEEGETLGEITEILSPGANDVWVVKRPKGKPLLLPYIDDVILDVDVEGKKVTARLMEGLLDL
ncbi:ribosome maturation factor RimM [Paenibacillus validus]|uniref:Ribosome maturation factor RimM n=1 Tax=Paenibacillus validus TaxID=44253 RepID=A0A7X3CS96_9BACL|nr:ribosome maturation factor RimM [Paenibacillus validus]MED4603837.1 ribosome maturation factor RimM [Paenibacillus validus]MED4608499.1 ribosome maturation factor RimM [Paenibacillus validus]MUG70556.1 ribosome maturation factor RimM [Paenibacillus validus]